MSDRRTETTRPKRTHEQLARETLDAIRLAIEAAADDRSAVEVIRVLLGRGASGAASRHRIGWTAAPGCEADEARPLEADVTAERPGSTLPRSELTLDQARAKLSGWHFAQEALTEGEREILHVAEALLRLHDVEAVRPGCATHDRVSGRDPNVTRLKEGTTT